MSAFPRLKTPPGRYATSEADGVFTLTDIRSTSVAFEITHIGYGTFRRQLHLTTAITKLGDIPLDPRTIPMGEVVISEAPPAIQKADTTEYFAGAFKTNRDATTEDLVGKLPGVSVVNGSVKAEGEDIQQVLVDGKPFFGSDPTLALRNLPADAVEKIQVFDKMSDQAEFTGFDDGNSVKTLNIITKESRRHSQFGKLFAGYGEHGYYNDGGSLNIFDGAERITVLGLSNDVNQQNFSMQDLLGVTGGGGRGGGSGGGGMRGGFGGGGGGGGRTLMGMRPPGGGGGGGDSACRPWRGRERKCLVAGGMVIPAAFGGVTMFRPEHGHPQTAGG